MADLRKLYHQEGLKAISEKTLSTYNQRAGFKRDKGRLYVTIPVELIEYVKATSKGPGQIGERIEGIILQDLKQNASQTDVVVF